MMDSIPIYEVVFDENSDITAISLVTDPAVQSYYMAFSEGENVRIELADSEERLVLGAALIPDKLILRRDDEGNPFYIRFSREVIKKTAYSYFRNQKLGNINAQHDPDSMLDGVYVVGGFIKDSQKGINPPAKFSDLPDGTWFVLTKIDNDEVWSEYVKTGVLRGYSIEAWYSLANTHTSKPVSMSEEDEISALLDVILSKLDKIEP